MFYFAYVSMPLCGADVIVTSSKMPFSLYPGKRANSVLCNNERIQTQDCNRNKQAGKQHQKGNVKLVQRKFNARKTLFVLLLTTPNWTKLEKKDRLISSDLLEL